MSKTLRMLMIGAHPDDCDILAGGLALKYIRAGHQVKFISMASGSRGHHVLSPVQTAARRLGETENVSALTGIEYEVWDIPDCELVASLPNRERTVRAIRAYKPDVIFTHRINDYHADHRNAAQLVQDAAYLLIVPHYCQDTPALSEMPVIMHFFDNFRNPPFQPDVVVDIDDVIIDKYRILDCHVSQMYEWLPYTLGSLEQVPADPEARFEWLQLPRLPQLNRPLELSDFPNKRVSPVSEFRLALPAVKYREDLLRHYGYAPRFAEAFAVSEYGKQLTPDTKALFFPF